jgi:AcrR family transcriptional regulator
MAIQTPTKRKYDSSRRKFQAQETRRLIVETSRSLFIELGYDGTTIDAIAGAAGVAPETVYAVFQNKRKILWHLMDISIGGDDQPIHLMDRPEPQAVLYDPDPVHQIMMFSQGITEILNRAAPIFEVLRTAAKTDKEFADLVQNLLKERLENMTLLVEHIAKNGGLRNGLNISAGAELVWTITSPEVFLLITRDRKNSKEYYSTWLQVTLTQLLLP